ncbi:MAG: ACP S-malonyltransferase [Chloroflexi bacterium]|nr:ACP S-malonyltransferase [Chloroflexota bacterium]
MASTTALVFPGQGSQTVGMGQDIAAAHAVARQTFEEADDVLGFRFSEICFAGPEDTLNDTLNTQPALYVCGVAILRVLQGELSDIAPLCAAGHSLGEFTALTAAGALSFPDGLRLVRERGRLMKQAGEQQPGAMAALLGLDAEAARALCAQASAHSGRPVVLANDNCPGQVVISGDASALEKALELAAAAGVKKAVKLAVSIAAHSPLMETAAAEFRQALDTTRFYTPRIAVYGNVSTQPLTSVEAIRDELNQQLTQSVRWAESVRAMIAAGAERFIEIGPKDVLSGLLKRIDRGKSGVALNSAAALQAFIAQESA